MAIKTINDTHLTSIADAIRSKLDNSELYDNNGNLIKYTPAEMAPAIRNLPGTIVKPVIAPLNITENGEYTAHSGVDGYNPVTVNVPTGGAGIPSEALTISGDCKYRFAYNGWNWFIDTYGDQITTSNIVSCNNMFFNASHLVNIPFDINISSTVSSFETENMFNSCARLESIPKITRGKIASMYNMFYMCYNLKNLPDDIANWFDWSYLEGLTTSYSGNRSSMFSNCYSLRSIPMDFLTHVNKNCGYNYSYFNNGFNTCSSLDELINLPIPYTATWTNNTLGKTFVNCRRLKNITFALQEDGTPYVMNWKSQTIDLTSYVGYTQYASYILDYNSGITADKEVTDDTTYQALKDDPDWFTTNVAYSRYNHDSAVATINSLPDTSAYLAANGGTNTIKFKGESGSATDGGAINTLTEEEIAVATAKGWTVTLV